MPTKLDSSKLSKPPKSTPSVNMELLERALELPRSDLRTDAEKALDALSLAIFERFDLIEEKLSTLTEQIEASTKQASALQTQKVEENATLEDDGNKGALEENMPPAKEAGGEEGGKGGDEDDDNKRGEEGKDNLDKALDNGDGKAPAPPAASTDEKDKAEESKSDEDDPADKKDEDEKDD